MRINLLNDIEDKSIDTILTDAPYDLSKDEIDYYHDQFKRIAKEWIIVFMSPENPWVYPADQYLYWIKPISTKNTSKRYSRFVECIYIYGEGTWNSDRHWSQYTNVFTDIVDNNKDHPFRKPPSLIERLILNHTNEGQKILDPFMGSGVVGEVCKKLNRDFIGIEQDLDYYNLASNKFNF